MPLSNLRKAAILDQSITENSREMERLVSLCYNKPLYYSWHAPKHEQKYKSTKGQCCLWHVLGPELKALGHITQIVSLCAYLFTSSANNNHDQIL
jgi:hypothetical protein